jgi:hypothetical protein
MFDIFHNKKVIKILELFEFFQLSLMYKVEKKEGNFYV